MIHILILRNATYTYTQGCYIYLYSRMILKDATYTYTQGLHIHILILRDATYTYNQGCYILKDTIYTYTQ